MLGGRPIHPINIAVGGFYRAPKRDDLQRLIPSFEWGLDAAMDLTRWVATFDFPDVDRPCEMVSLAHPDEYPMNEGDLVSTSGLRINVADYEREFEEHQVVHSTALHSVHKLDGRPYLVGPAARVSLNFERFGPPTRRIADEVGFEIPCVKPFRTIAARALEVVYAYDEALNILRDYQTFQPPRSPLSTCAGEGCAATEAPRGLIYHRYGIDDSRKVTAAKIVPPTSQNQTQIENDLRRNH